MASKATYDVTLVGRFNRPRTAPAEALDVYHWNRTKSPSKLPEYTREMRRFFRNGYRAQRFGIVDVQDTKLKVRADSRVLRRMRDALNDTTDRWTTMENGVYDLRGEFEFQVAVQAESEAQAFGKAQRYLDRAMESAMCRSPELVLL